MYYLTIIIIRWFRFIKNNYNKKYVYIVFIYNVYEYENINCSINHILVRQTCKTDKVVLKL
jgi:hypothetical protein